MQHKDPKFPAMLWHPESGESQIFHAPADVPDGWLDRHPAHKEADEKAAPPKAPAAIPMSKEDIQAALTSGGIEFKKNAGHKALYDLLVTSVKAHLTEKGIEFLAAATAPQLLALVPNNE